jgi:hypothetical protein
MSLRATNCSVESPHGFRHFQPNIWLIKGCSIRVGRRIIEELKLEKIKQVVDDVLGSINSLQIKAPIACMLG